MEASHSKWFITLMGSSFLSHNESCAVEEISVDQMDVKDDSE